MATPGLNLGDRSQNLSVGETQQKALSSTGFSSMCNKAANKIVLKYFWRAAIARRKSFLLTTAALVPPARERKSISYLHTVEEPSTPLLKHLRAGAGRAAGSIWHFPNQGSWLDQHVLAAFAGQMPGYTSKTQLSALQSSQSSFSRGSTNGKITSDYLQHAVCQV